MNSSFVELIKLCLRAIKKIFSLHSCRSLNSRRKVPDGLYGCIFGPQQNVVPDAAYDDGNQ